MRRHPVETLLCLLCFLVFAVPSWAQVAGQAPRAKAPATAVTEGESENVERLNKWTVGLAGGQIDGTYIKFAADIGTALDDDDNLRVLTVLTKGSVQNVYDLLYLKGVDAGLVSADTFEQFKNEGKIKNIENRIQYVSQIHVSSLQLLVRPEIKTLKDLEGKKVAMPPKGSSSTALALKVLERNNVKVEAVEVGNAGGIEKVKTGECAAVFRAFAKGAPTLFSNLDPKLGFHLLPIAFDKFADEYYVPVLLEHEDYPNLIAQQEKIETLGSPVVLAVYNWPRGTDRFRKVERFVQYYFDRIDKLKKPPFHPQWKEVNLAATVPGWKRYWFAEEMLKKVTASTAAARDAATGRAAVAGGGDSEQERLFGEFLQWKKEQGQR